MEKQDILVVVIAIVAFAVLALLVRPLLVGPIAGTGPGTGIRTTPTVAVTPSVTQVVTPAKTVPTLPPTTPAPTPTWDGSVKSVGFVGQPEGQVTPTPNPTIPQPSLQNRSLVTYATISNRWPGTTENVYVPAPWWVLEYTAEPMALPPNAYPMLIIQVFDAQDPNRLVIAPIRQYIYEEPSDTPWSQKLYEGRRTYYFRVDTSFIKTYTIRIKVPLEYT
ncbi:MAG TPA: hypothetical protein VKO45_05375 [Methanomicrobiales archaeon]|nr:hypothetical protein [Methanomicrobiales archaeon]